MSPIFDFISGFVKITDDEAASITQLVHFGSYPKNGVIQKQGEIARNVWFVLKGAVRVYYVDDTGAEQTVKFVLENQPLIAFDSFASQTPAGTTAVALEPTEVVGTTHPEFFGFIEAHPRYETAVRSILGQYLLLESDHSKLLRINPARSRWEALCKAQPELVTRVPLKYLASYIGITLETLSRIRAGKL